MTKRTYSTFFLAATILGFAAALSACGSGADQAAAPETPTAPTTQTSEPTTAPTTEPATGPATGTPTGKPADVTKDDDGCPVAEGALLKIVNNHGDFATTVALPGLDCYKGWATGNQEVSKEYIEKRGQVQPVAFVFRYDRSAGHWTYAAAGTSDICPASMPADIRKHFRVCTY